MKGRFPALLALIFTAAAAVSSGAATQQVRFTTEDGVSIAATLYTPSRPGPAIILLHPLTRSRDDWRSLGQRLSEAGFVALAIDLRGHGASDRPPASTAAGRELGGMAGDIKAARAFLAARRDVVQGRVGLLGASVGANLAVAAAASDQVVKSIALLSPGLDFKGVRTEAALNRYGNRPALMVGSREDNYVMMSMRRLASQGAGRREQVVLEAAGHGTAMVERHAELVGMLVDWFKRTLL